MNYLMLPLDKHSDDGLGATGEAFEAAATALAAQAETLRTFHVHLPINFLYRHAIELFLKSMVVVLHRGLAVPYGDHAHDGPAFVMESGKWKAIHKVHSVAVLWEHVQSLIGDHAAELRARCRTDWQAAPEELAGDIAAIEKADASSTYFRYPDARRPTEEEKSSWKAKHPEDIIASAKTTGKPTMSVLLTLPDGSVTEAFQYDREPLSELSRILVATAKTLAAAHKGLRVELADGF